MEILKYNRVLCLCILLFAGCRDKGIQPPVVEAGNPYQPVIKIKLNAAQRAAGKKAGWETVSGLFVIYDNEAARQPVGCNYSYKNDTLYYSPLHPLGAGLEFEIQACSSGDTLRQRFSTPKNAGNTPPPAVTAIYPHTQVIPSNILMFHVLFSTPMTEDIFAYKQVKLLDDKGNEKPKAWREKSNWVPGGRHLVLMLHPGRIKRGINYFDEPLFEPGQQYTLVITTQLRDATNRPLEQEYRKTFTVTGPDRSVPVFRKEKFTPPQAGSREPVTLSFSEMMDYGAMNIGILVKDENSNKIGGTLTTTDEKNWQFIPAAQWQKTTYTVELNDYVADLASNHLTRRFEETELDSMRNRHPVAFSFTPR